MPPDDQLAAACQIVRRDLASPYIIIGSIVSAFGTAALKKLIAQERPAGSPFTDPGMPSSHAVVSTFAGVAWTLHLRNAFASFWLLAAAATVSGLRVVCGYHTVAQSLVGVALGALSACGWMACFPWLLSAPQTATRAVYAGYVGGSALFIQRKMSAWARKDALDR